jgi:hypothetical protein
MKLKMVPPKALKSTLKLGMFSFKRHKGCLGKLSPFADCFTKPYYGVFPL